MARICNQLTSSTEARDPHPVDDEGDHCAVGHRSRPQPSSFSPAPPSYGHSAPMARRVRALRDDALFAEETPKSSTWARSPPRRPSRPSPVIRTTARPPGRRPDLGTVGAWLVCGYEDAPAGRHRWGAVCPPRPAGVRLPGP